MKRTLLSICYLGAAVLVATKFTAYAQSPLPAYAGVKPWTGGTLGEAINASNAATTIPMAGFSFKASKDNNNYTDVIVGRNPFLRGKTTTSVNVLVVPIIVTIGGQTFDSTAPNNCGGSNGHSDVDNFVNSPILSNVTFDGAGGPGHGSLVNGVNMGTSTYPDMFRRAEFLNAIGGPTSAYHTTFNVTVTAPYTIPAADTAGHSTIITGSGCSLLGGLEINFFDNYFVNTVLPARGGNPTNFPLFLMHNVIFYDTVTSNCCILGYHGTVGNPPQTYSPTDYDTTGDFGAGIVNVSVAAHEIGEWLDDPLGNNPTPPWGHTGQVHSCQGNWEVGDPLTGTNFPAITMPNGVTYNPQELAFWGWYYSANGDPNLNIGAGGLFSDHGTFLGPSKVCPPGGTF